MAEILMTNQLAMKLENMMNRNRKETEILCTERGDDYTTGCLLDYKTIICKTIIN